MKKVISVVLLFQLLCIPVFAYSSERDLTEEQRIQSYITALDSFIESCDEDLKSMDYISIDMNTEAFKSISEEGKEKILKHFKKYKVKVLRDSLEILKKKRVVKKDSLKYSDIEGTVINGILLGIKKVKLQKDKTINVEGYWYISPKVTKSFVTIIEEKHGKHKVKQIKVIPISKN